MNESSVFSLSLSPGTWSFPWTVTRTEGLAGTVTDLAELFSSDVEQALGFLVVYCFWPVVCHGIVAHQHKVFLQSTENFFIWISCSKCAMSPFLFNTRTMHLYITYLYLHTSSGKCINTQTPTSTHRQTDCDIPSVHQASKGCSRHRPHATAASHAEQQSVKILWPDHMQDEIHTMLLSFGAAAGNMNDGKDRTCFIWCIMKYFYSQSQQTIISPGLHWWITYKRLSDSEMVRQADL